MTSPASEEIQSDPHEMIKRLRKKAKLMQFCHGRLAESANRTYDCLSAFVVVISALCTVLIFADYQRIAAITRVPGTVLQFVAGMLSVIVFVLSELLRRFDWSSQAGKHREALERYTAFLRDSEFFLKSELPFMSCDQAVQQSKDYEKIYLDAGQKSPPISGGLKFLRLKQEYLVTKEISIRLDKDPFVDVRRMWRRIGREREIDRSSL